MTSSEETIETSEVTSEETMEDTSRNMTEASEVTREDTDGNITNASEALPEHSFASKTINGKIGKMKGIKRITWTLIIGPYTFTKNKDYGDYAYFVCNECLKLKKHVGANCNRIYGKTKEEDTWTLASAPSHDAHLCIPSVTESTIKLARMILLETDAPYFVPETAKKNLTSYLCCWQDRGTEETECSSCSNS